MIKYDIHSIQNVAGTGEQRKYVHILEREAMTEEQLYQQIEERCSLTRGDVEHALRALATVMGQQLGDGHRFCLPGIGYFSLQAAVDKSDEKPIEKVRGQDISVRNLNYRPAKTLLQTVQRAAHFERSQDTSLSRNQSDDELKAAIRSYLSTHTCLTRRTLEMEFHLRRSTAQRTLARLNAEGFLRKDGTNSAPVYFLASS